MHGQDLCPSSAGRQGGVGKHNPCHTAGKWQSSFQPVVHTAVLRAAQKGDAQAEWRAWRAGQYSSIFNGHLKSVSCLIRNLNPQLVCLDQLWTCILGEERGTLEYDMGQRRPSGAAAGPYLLLRHAGEEQAHAA